MKIAVTSPNAKTISGHAGKCPGYLIFDIKDNTISHQQHLKLTKEQVFKNFSGPLSQAPQHPLHDIDAFITQSLGAGLKQRLATDNIRVYTTDQTDPHKVVNMVLGAYYSPSATEDR